MAEGVGRINLLDAEHPEKWNDYTYDELVDLVFNIMREKNPEMTSGKKKVNKNILKTIKIPKNSFPDFYDETTTSPTSRQQENCIHKFCRNLPSVET